MAKGEKLFRRKVAIGKLVGEKHTDDGGHRKGIENQRLFPGGKLEAGKVTKDQWKPCSPDEELQNHHDKKAKFHRHGEDSSNRGKVAARQGSYQCLREGSGGIQTSPLSTKWVEGLGEDFPLGPCW